MKYKTSIIPQGNSKYIGQLLEEGQVIYTTNELNDPILVSRELAEHVSSLTTPGAIAPKITPSPASAPPAPVNKSASQGSAPSVPSHRQTPPPKRCCGRG